MLIVEGATDQHFILNLALATKMAEKSFPEPTPLHSRDKAIKRFISDLKSDRSEPLGLIIDADGSFDNTVTELVKKLPKTENVKPADFNQGLIFSPPSEPRAGIWIWPDSSKTGILEDLFLELVSQEDPLLKEAHRVVDALPSIEPWRFKAQYRSKAVVHTWLAWQEKPGLPIGTSLNRSPMDLTHPTVSNFKSWLQRLYQHD
jgi:hypothetical protein